MAQHVRPRMGGRAGVHRWCAVRRTALVVGLVACLTFQAAAGPGSKEKAPPSNGLPLIGKTSSPGAKSAPIGRGRTSGPAKASSAQGAKVDPSAAVAESELHRLRGDGKKAPAGRRVHKLGLLPSRTKPGLYKGGAAPRSQVRPLEVPPASVDRSAGLPPIGDQAAQGSCVGFACGYYYKTYQEGKERGWELTTSQHQASPAFLYNQVAPYDEGATFDEVFNLLADQGCGTLADCPFRDTDSVTWPSYPAFLKGIPWRAQSYTRLGDGTTSGIIDAMRARLASGDLCVIGLPIYRATASTPGRFDLLSPTDFYYQRPALEDTYIAGGHALAVVGYDDTLFDGQGGFKIVNSWGSDWGNHGFAYLSYEFITSYVFDVYTMDDRYDYQPTAVARFKLSHSFWGVTCPHSRYHLLS